MRLHYIAHFIAPSDSPSVIQHNGAVAINGSQPETFRYGTFSRQISNVPNVLLTCSACSRAPVFAVVHYTLHTHNWGSVQIAPSSLICAPTNDGPAGRTDDGSPGRTRGHGAPVSDGCRHEPDTRRFRWFASAPRFVRSGGPRLAGSHCRPWSSTRVSWRGHSHTLTLGGYRAVSGQTFAQPAAHVSEVPGSIPIRGFFRFWFLKPC